MVLGEFTTICSSRFWKYFEGLQFKNKLVVRVGLDLDKLEADPEALINLYRTLDEYLDIDFVFYDMKESANANLIILKGSFVVQYALDPQMRFKMCTYIFDESMVWDIYENSASPALNRGPSCQRQVP